MPDDAIRKPPLLVLIGPTASGKTALSLAIAQHWNAEIISGDSMQVYRGMDIGTAKLPERDRRGIPHHLIDIRDPDEPYSAHDFQQEAARAAQAIAARGKLPFVVGGTGLYVESFCYDYEFTEAAADEAFREEQRRYAERYGPEALLDKLAAVDPASAERLHAHDQRRIIRALEIHHQTGIPMSRHLAQQDRRSRYDLCLVGLAMERPRLYARIEQRVDMMVREGLFEEVRRLRRQGYGPELPAMQGLGYKEILGCLQGEYDESEAVRLLKRNTRHFAKRQIAWFRHMKDIHWVDVSEQGNFSAHIERIHDIITAKYGVEG